MDDDGAIVVLGGDFEGEEEAGVGVEVTVLDLPLTIATVKLLLGLSFTASFPEEASFEDGVFISSLPAVGFAFISFSGAGPPLDAFDATSFDLEASG